MGVPHTKTSRRAFVVAAAAVPWLPGWSGGARAEPARAGRAPGLGGPIFDVTRFGAVGDGRRSCTSAIQRALDACARAGGGVVQVPPGRYLTGALFLCSDLHLRLLPGSVLVASDRFEDFPPIDGRSEGIERKTYASLLTGERVENVAITGGGTLDGQGPRWWQAHDVTNKQRLERNLKRDAENPPGAPLRWPRPRLINFLRSTSVTITGISLTSSPFYNVHLVYCQDVLVEGLSISALQALNIDGIIVDSCKQVRVTSCSIASGSDAIAVKSGYNQDGRRVGIPCEEVVITNCNLACSGGAGISVGSETAGGIRNISISNCTVVGSRYGIQVRSPRGRGGVVERIRVFNMVFDRLTAVGVYITHFYDSVKQDSLFAARDQTTGNPETDRSMRAPVDEGTPTFQDLDFSGLTFGAVPILGLIEGLPERFIRGVRLGDISAPVAKAGLSIRRATEITVNDLCAEPTEGPVIAGRDIERLRIRGLVCARPDPRAAVVLEDVKGAFLSGCDVPNRPLLETRGDKVTGVTVVGNNAPSRPG